MTIRVCTRQYINSHGVEPRGDGLWQFDVAYCGHDGTGYRDMTRRVRVNDSYRYALSTAKQRVRRELRTNDATITVLP